MKCSNFGFYILNLDLLPERNYNRILLVGTLNKRYKLIIFNKMSLIIRTTPLVLYKNGEMYVL
jgi:hypothetical protein